MTALRDSLALWLLLVLILMLRPAYAHCTPVEDYQTREEHQPMIVASTTHEESYRTGFYFGELVSTESVLKTVYGSEITVICASNNASNLIIQGETHLQTETLNSTAIQVIVEKLDIGEYTFTCTDNYSGCNDSLAVYVDPAMSVMAPRVGYTSKYNPELYFVPSGEIFDVFCTGNQASALELEVYPSKAKPLRVQTINDTTIAMSRRVEIGVEEYTCSNQDGQKRIRVIVDYYPEARMFRCILYTEERTLECTWVSFSQNNAFRLYALLNEESLLICRDKSDGLNRGCASKLDDELAFIAYNDFVLQLRACNEVICSNQTFSIKTASIKKLKPIIGFKIISTTSQGADLEWSHENWESDHRVHRIEYRMLGAEWRPVNSSEVEQRFEDFAIHLDLPCPDAHYEVRVSARYEEATEDIYWSDPVSVFFFTAKSTGEVDPACNKNFREVTEKAPPSADVMLYEVRELISDEREKKASLNKLISRLNQKLAKIKAILKAQE